jgi:ATP-dependent Lhr-like helicase
MDVRRRPGQCRARPRAGLSDRRPKITPPVSEQALDGLKFSECLPPELATRVVQARFSDAGGVAEVLERPMRIVYES